MIAAPVQCDVDVIPKGSHYISVSTIIHPMPRASTRPDSRGGVTKSTRHRRLRADNAKLGGLERSYVADNARELERLRALVSKLSDQDLGSMVNEYWTVAGVLGHMAFWDGCALFLAGKLQRDGAFTPSDTEPENVDWLNDSTRPLIHAIPPRQAAEVALRIAEETDELVASLSHELVAKIDANSPLNPVRAHHRGEHLDEIEAALAGRDATRRPT